MFQVTGEIDINPPLTWSEVQPTGFMVMNANGVPKVPDGRYVELVATEEIIDRSEGTMHKFTFASLAATDAQIDEPNREVFRAQVAETIAAFPTHVFGAANRTIRFRGDLIDDQWRIRLDADGVTVRRQVANLTWVDAV